MDVVNFSRSFNKVLNFPALWENEVLLNALFYLFHLFIYKSVISWWDVTVNIGHIKKISFGFCFQWTCIKYKLILFSIFLL